MSNKQKYLLLPVAGLFVIFLCSLVREPRTMNPSLKNYFSYFLISNYSILTAILFFIVGVAIGYYWKLNPWLCGLCLIAVFPLTSIIEAIIDITSHNLIPFEFVMHFIQALPAIIGVYLGKFIWGRKIRAQIL